MNVFYQKLSEALSRAGHLEGVISENKKDDVVIKGDAADDYLLVLLLGKLVSRGALKIEVSSKETEYLARLLKLSSTEEIPTYENKEEAKDDETDLYNACRTSR